MRLLNTIIIVLILAVSAAAQSSKTVVFIDSNKFYDKTGGIKRLVLAKRMSESFTSVYTLRSDKIKVEREKLIKEIDTLKSKGLPNENRQEKLRNLSDEYERMRVLAEATYKKQESILLKPVTNDILEILKNFAELRRYIVIDAFEAYLTENDLGITAEFIEFCNETFERKR